jgi:site-specific DNA-cytosine methylase
VVAAIDIDQLAQEIYRLNFSHPTSVRTIESLTAGQLCELAADLWWLSPPCQPYTLQGRCRDVFDPRAASLLNVIQCLAEAQPGYLALENVVGFASSQMRRRLIDQLRRLGYLFDEQIICAQALGLPQRRRRYYLIAAREGNLASPPTRPPTQSSLASLLNGESTTPACLEDRRLPRIRGRLHLVQRTDATGATRCFTAAYGRSPTRSGSYWIDKQGQPRHFAPDDLLRLFGFPSTFRLPSHLTYRQAWSRIGNSLAVPVVRHVLARVPQLTDSLTSDVA